MWKLTSKPNNKELRMVFADTLIEMMNTNKNLMVLEADLAGASMTGKIKDAHPTQFVNVGIAEANMVGIAAGMSLVGFVPYIHTFAPFATRRVFDQLFISGGYSHNNIKIYGSDPGVCVATNGGTHTSFEDIALVRSIPNSMIFDVADQVQMQWLLKELATLHGIHYMRANRKAVPAIYEEGSTFTIGKGNKIKDGSDILLISMGQVLDASLKAAHAMDSKGVSVEVIDMFTVKPLDVELILQSVKGKKAVLTVENHSVTGGLGSAVAEVLAENNCGVKLCRMGIKEQYGQVGPIEYLEKAYKLTQQDIEQTLATL